MRIRLVALVQILLLGLGAAATADGPRKHAVLRERLETALRDIARRLDGVMGYAIVDLTGGDRFGHLEDEPFPTASTIKLAVLYELFRQADEGKVRLDVPAPLDRALVVGGSGILGELTRPALSLRDHAVLMMVLSDNTATNVVIEALGLAGVNSRLAALGLRGTKLRRLMMDEAAARRGDENVSTPEELARLLEIIHRGEGLTPAGHAALLAILQKPRASAMVRGLPPGTRTAGKPGSLAGVQVDAGIVYVEDRPYVFAAMTTFLREGPAGEAAIEDASRAAYEYFRRLADGTAYGRQIGR